MEELAKIRRSLISENKKYYDFGTGDPKLETPIFIREALKNSIPEISQYPSISGNPNLIAAIKSYIEKIIIPSLRTLRLYQRLVVRKLSFMQPCAL